MNTPGDQILMGCMLAVVCLLGLVYSRWFATTTPKGQRLVNWLGEPQAILLLRVLFAIGMALGIALAADWIRPLFDSRNGI